MSDSQAIADGVEIDSLRGEFTDAGMMGDYHRVASLFTDEGVWRIPGIAEFFSQNEIRAGIERLQGHWDYFVQNVHPGSVYGVLYLDTTVLTGSAPAPRG